MKLVAWLLRRRPRNSTPKPLVLGSLKGNEAPAPPLQATVLEDENLVAPWASKRPEGVEPEAQPEAASVALDAAPEADEEAAGDDPTIGRHEPLEIDTGAPERVALARQDARRRALAGAHNINPNDPAGPGSLAEALMQLEALGQVRSQVLDDPEHEFCVRYEPVARAATG